MTDSSKAGRGERFASLAITSSMEWTGTVESSLPAISGKGNCSRESTCLSAVSIGHGYLNHSETAAEPIAEIGVGVAVFVVV